MSRHLMAKMRRLSDYEEKPDVPHNDWLENPNLVDGALAWHPLYGESHVQYSIAPFFVSGKKLWSLVHSGIYQGMESFDDYGETITHNKYRYDRERSGGVDLGAFPTPEEAMARAQDHYFENYDRNKPSGDYYDNALKHINDPENGYDIFGDRS